MWAIVVLSVISFLPIAPAFTNAIDNNQLPPCCRAHGKHKCAMRSQVFDSNNSETAPAIYSLCDRFPLLQLVSSTTVNAFACLPKAAQQFFAALVSHPTGQEQTEARFRISFERSRQKRGPPAFLS